MEKGNYTQAISLFAKSIELDKYHYASYYFRAYCYHKNEEYAKALADLNKAIELHGSNGAMYVLRGMVNSKLGDSSKALNDYMRALEFDANDKIVYNNIGAIKEKQGLFREALSSYNKALEIDPYFSIATSNKKRVEKELEVIAVEQPSGKTAKECFLVAVQAGDEGDYEEAIQWYNRTLELDANYKNVYSNRGWAKYMLSNYSGAIEDFTKVITTNPMDKWAYNQRGQAYIHLKLFEKGRQDFRKALQIDADYQVARQNLTAIENRLGLQTDEKAPKILIISPTNTSRGLEVVKLDETVTVLGRAEDESGIDKVYINGTMCTVDNGTGEFKASLNLNLGKNTIVVVAWDTKGNKAEKSFVIDRKSPETVGEGALKNDKSSLLSLLGTSYALIFVTDEYEEWDVLSNPIYDGEALAEILEKKYGFKVEIVRNATQREFLQKIKEYATKTFAPTDQLFIFGAGHGHFDASLGEGYIIAKDSKKNDDAAVSYIAQSSFCTYVDNIKCNHILVMLDICFAGTFDPIVKRRGNEDAGIAREEFVTRKLQYKTRMYITSAGKEYVSDGIPGQHSPFANKILEGFNSDGGKDGILTVDEIFSFVSHLTPKPIGGKFGQNQPGSDFLFIAR
jgi:tetratricopeptide (TPR) repeat protein